MDFLLTHWHCILPIVGIVAAILLLKDNKSDTKKE